MKRIIVTGSSGFVGTNLINYLDRRDVEIIPLSVRWGNSIELPRADAVVHLSGKAHDLKNVSDPNSYFEANSLLTQQLFDLFLASDASVFIFLSSVKAAADTVTGELDETSVPDPQTPYGKSKLQAEEYILSQRIPDGKRVFVLRPCMIHGPGNKGNLNLLYKLVEKGIPYPLAAFVNRRSFLSVKNLCFVISEVINDESVPSGVYNVADDDALSTAEVIKIMAGELSKKSRLLNVNKSLIRLIAKAGDILHLPLNTERLKKLTEDYMVSNKKIRKVLRAPFPVTAVEGIQETVRAFMNKAKP